MARFTSSVEDVDSVLCTRVQAYALVVGLEKPQKREALAGTRRIRLTSVFIVAGLII